MTVVRLVLVIYFAWVRGILPQLQIDAVFFYGIRFGFCQSPSSRPVDRA